MWIFMKVVFSVGAALKSEKIKPAKRFNQSVSFVKLAIVVEGLDKFRTDKENNLVSFECDEFEIVEEHSSKGWKDLFPYRGDGKTVVINVPDKYILGSAIPGYY